MKALLLFVLLPLFFGCETPKKILIKDSDNCLAFNLNQGTVKLKKTERRDHHYTITLTLPRKNSGPIELDVGNLSQKNETTWVLKENYFNETIATLVESKTTIRDAKTLKSFSVLNCKGTPIAKMIQKSSMNNDVSTPEFAITQKNERWIYTNEEPDNSFTLKADLSLNLHSKNLKRSPAKLKLWTDAKDQSTNIDIRNTNNAIDLRFVPFLILISP